MKRLLCILFAGLMPFCIACTASPGLFPEDVVTDAPAVTDSPEETPNVPVFTHAAIPTSITIDPGLIVSTPPPVGIYDPTPELASESITPAPDADD